MEDCARKLTKRIEACCSSSGGRRIDISNETGLLALQVWGVSRCYYPLSYFFYPFSNVTQRYQRYWISSASLRDHFMYWYLNIFFEALESSILLFSSADGKIIVGEPWNSLKKGSTFTFLHVPSPLMPPTAGWSPPRWLGLVPTASIWRHLNIIQTSPEGKGMSLSSYLAQTHFAWYWTI